MRTDIYSRNSGEHNSVHYGIAAALAALALAVLAGCGKPPAPEKARPQRETILMPESVRAESTGADITPAGLNTARLAACVEAYAAALAPADRQHVTTSTLAALALPVDVLKERALQCENPLTGLAYAETLLERAEDDDTRSYARLRIAQHAAALFDFTTALNALEAIPDDRTTSTSENRTYEKHIACANVALDLGEYAKGLEYARALLAEPARHQRNQHLRLSLLLAAARCAAHLNDHAGARNYLEQITASAPADDPVLALTKHNARSMLADYPAFVRAVNESRAHNESRRTFYQSRQSGSFDEIVRERELTIGRSLTAVERVQLFNRMRQFNSHANPRIGESQ